MIGSEYQVDWPGPRILSEVPETASDRRLLQTFHSCAECLFCVGGPVTTIQFDKYRRVGDAGLRLEYHRGEQFGGSVNFGKYLFVKNRIHLGPLELVENILPGLFGSRTNLIGKRIQLQIGIIDRFDVRGLVSIVIMPGALCSG